MKTLSQIIEAYRADNHLVDGLLIAEVQNLPEEEILDIIEKAEGRDIIVKADDEDVIDGQWYDFDGDIESDFDMSKYF